jgi:hypothetical protein
MDGWRTKLATTFPLPTKRLGSVTSARNTARPAPVHSTFRSPAGSARASARKAELWYVSRSFLWGMTAELVAIPMRRSEPHTHVVDIGEHLFRSSHTIPRIGIQQCLKEGACPAESKWRRYNVKTCLDVNLSPAVQQGLPPPGAVG